MRLIHIGLVSSSEEKADRFFGSLLGLSKTRRSQLPAELAMRLFAADRGCEMVYYEGDELVFEVFLTGQSEPSEKKISHTCIEVPNRGELLERCGAMGFGVRQAPRGDGVVVFIEDGDGNLFEVKEKG